MALRALPAKREALWRLALFLELYPRFRPVVFTCCFLVGSALTGARATMNPIESFIWMERGVQ